MSTELSVDEDEDYYPGEFRQREKPLKREYRAAKPTRKKPARYRRERPRTQRAPLVIDLWE